MWNLTSETHTPDFCYDTISLEGKSSFKLPFGELQQVQKLYYDHDSYMPLKAGFALKLSYSINSNLKINKNYIFQTKDIFKHS